MPGAAAAGRRARALGDKPHRPLGKGVALIAFAHQRFIAAGRLARRQPQPGECSASQMRPRVIARSLASKPSSDFSKHKRSEEHTSELQSLMSNSYDVLCLKKQRKI